MNRKIIVVLASAFLFVFSSSIFAVHPKSSGFYIGGDIGYGAVAKYKYFKNENDRDSTEEGFGWEANMGYQFTKYYGAEVGFLGFPSYNYAWHGMNMSSKNNYATTLALVNTMRSDNGFGCFLKIGATFTHHEFVARTYDASYTTVNTRKTGIGMLLGGGFEYALTQNISAILAINILFGGNAPEMEQCGLGFRYTF